MKVEVDCPYCEKKFKFKDGKQYKQDIRCPHCKAVIEKKKKKGPSKKERRKLALATR